MDWNEVVIAAPAAFLLGVIVGYIVRGRYEFKRSES